jgi:branched-chain amino acid transport system permease protein
MAMPDTASAEDARRGFRNSVWIFVAVIAGFALLAVFLRKAEGWWLAGVTVALIAAVLVPALRNLFQSFARQIQHNSLVAAIAAGLGAMLMPLFLENDGYWIHVLSAAMIFSIMAIGLNIHLGEIGLVNLGYAGLFAFGAYTATLATEAGYPFWFATLLAIMVCWIVGGLVGACSIRTSGDYFALVTLGFGLIVHQLIINMIWLTRGNDGITNISPVSVFGHTSKMPIDLGFVQMPAQANFYYLCLISLIAAALIARRYQIVWIGRMWTALRQDSIGVSSFGLNVPLFKVQTVAFGSAFAGLAGSLFAHQIGFISPDDFTLLHSIEVLAAVILGGMGNIFGAVIGGIILHVAPEKLRFLGDYRLLIYGGMLVVILIFRPLGLLPDPRRRYEKF